MAHRAGVNAAEYHSVSLWQVHSISTIMNQQDIEAILGIVTLAALADGQRDAAEQEKIVSVAARLGLTNADDIVRRTMAGDYDLATLTGQLSDDAARQTAFDSALSVCHADGTLGAAELAFMERLRGSLGLDQAFSASRLTEFAAVGSAANQPGSETSDNVRNAVASAGDANGGSGAAAGADDLDAYILDQAMLTAALEFLPDRLANLGILPLQLRLVRNIGLRTGQQPGASQIKDLAATFGIGAAAQVMETVVRRTLGGLAGGIFGGMLGGAAGVAAGGAVTFASTYALGHAAKQYYAQGRTLSTEDMRSLFARFQGEANTMFPRVQERVASLARDNGMDGIMRMVRG